MPPIAYFAPEDQHHLLQYIVWNNEWTIVELFDCGLINKSHRHRNPVASNEHGRGFIIILCYCSHVAPVQRTSANARGASIELRLVFINQKLLGHPLGHKRRTRSISNCIVVVITTERNMMWRVLEQNYCPGLCCGWFWLGPVMVNFNTKHEIYSHGQLRFMDINLQTKSV